MMNTTGPYAMQSQSTLFAEDERAHSDMQYRLLPSVWQGEDAELLEVMLDFYPHMPPQLILDATVNAGRFWRGSQRPVIGLDINASAPVEIKKPGPGPVLRQQGMFLISPP